VNFIDTPLILVPLLYELLLWWGNGLWQRGCVLKLVGHGRVEGLRQFKLEPQLEIDYLVG